MRVEEGRRRGRRNGEGKRRGEERGRRGVEEGKRGREKGNNVGSEERKEEKGEGSQWGNLAAACSL